MGKGWNKGREGKGGGRGKRKRKKRAEGKREKGMCLCTHRNFQKVDTCVPTAGASHFWVFLSDFIETGRL